MTDLRGRRALVTGSTSGIGRAIAAAFVAAGARVVVTGRDRGRAEHVAAALSETGAGEALGVALDVSDEASVAAAVGEAVDRLDGLDVLVNNAGVGVRFVDEHYLSAPRPFWEVAPARFRALLATNVDGYFLCSRAVVPAMVTAGHGRIINISINEPTMRWAHFSPYGPSRAATDAMSYAMAAELEGTGVTVNLLSPGGATDTAMITEEASPAFRARLIDPAVMGPPACWLASARSAGVNGTKIVAVDFARRGAPD